jgi:FkbM family methyltransferase
MNKLEETYRTLIGQSNVIYSQDGEDIIFNSLFKNKSNGFYVDVGAHHPYRFSNTYLLYKKGWSGINIDATPGTKKIFDQVRKRDINLELAISEKSGECYLYQFSEPALNCIKDIDDDYVPSSDHSRSKIKSLTLREVFKMYLKKSKIDLLLVDTEGYDLAVLKSNDWLKYCPTVVMVEIGTRSIDLISSTKLHAFLTTKRYKLAYKTYRNAIYLKE